MTGGAALRVIASGRLPAGTGRAVNPLFGLREFQHEYDEPQVEDQMPQQ
jgi:hypothetical protein